MKLYEISIELLKLWAQADELLDTDNTPDQVEQAKALSFLEGELKKMEGTHAQKCLDMACLVKDLEAEGEAIADEAAKLKARQASCERKAAWLRTYLQNNMEPGTNLKEPRAVIGWRKSAGVVVLCKVEELPESFRRTKTIIDADKTAIKEALAADPALAELSGKAVVEQRFNLQIK